jgi:hypothetical protein
MDNFILTHNYLWKSPNSEVLMLHYEPSFHAGGREGWSISLEKDDSGPKGLTGGHATIFANETVPDKTTVQFIDGKTFFLQGQKMDFNDPSSLGDIPHQLIGESLLLLCKAIEREWTGEIETVQSSIPSKPKDELAHGSELIPSIEYPGSVAHFRAWMDRFLAVNGQIFKVKKDAHTLEYHIGYFTPAHNTTREVWNVYIDPRIVVNGKRPGDSRFAMILAVEDRPNRTMIEFIDGHCYERTAYQSRSSTSEPHLGNAYLASHEPIGNDFVKIAKWIAEGLNENPTSNNIPNEPKTKDLIEWFDYLHKVRHRMRIKLEYIAEKTGYAKSTVKKAHSLYMKERGIQSNQK